MFGKNPQLPCVATDGSTLAVQDIFYTLQGEGPFSGMPAVFIRLAGCGLACTWCDTAFDRTDNVMSVRDIVDAVRTASQGRPCDLVVITGGEPLRQNVANLVHQLLCHRVLRVQLETAGYVDPQDTSSLTALLAPHQGATLDDLFTRGLHIVCSPKTPKISHWVRRYCRHWKYVVQQDDVHPYDGLPYKGTQAKGVVGTIDAPAIFRGGEGTIWVSPCDQSQDPRVVAPNGDRTPHNITAAVQSCLEHGHRLSLQVHKLVHLP